MLSRALRALALLPFLASPAMSAGTIAFSLSQQLDQSGKPLTGCQLHIYQAGTTATPQNAFQDTALTLPWPNPLICDAFGRLPQFFLADGLIKIRLDDKNGNTQVVADNILVIGPSSGGGGGGSIDPTTIAATGDLKVTYGTGTLTGWVRANGRTIGSATSGASERANADTQALFQFLWSADANLAVSGGRGVSSSADFAANKTIALPDYRNRAIAGLGDMGNSDAALFAGTTFTLGNSTTLGSSLGIGTPKSLLQSDLPNVAPTFTGTADTVTVSSIGIGVSQVNPGSGATGIFIVQGSSSPGFASGSFTPRGTVQSLNGNVSQTTFPTVSPLRLATIYVKL